MRAEEMPQYMQEIAKSLGITFISEDNIYFSSNYLSSDILIVNHCGIINLTVNSKDRSKAILGEYRLENNNVSKEITTCLLKMCPYLNS